MTKNNKKSNAGRKLFDGKDPKDVIPKLEQAALIDATVEEMCYYADISTSAYYRYLEDHPLFRDKIDALRNRLDLKARQNIASRIEAGDIGLSKWRIERRDPPVQKLKIEHSGSIAQPSGEVHPEDEALRIEYKTKLLENIRNRARQKVETKP